MGWGCRARNHHRLRGAVRFQKAYADFFLWGLLPPSERGFGYRGEALQSQEGSGAGLGVM